MQFPLPVEVKAAFETAGEARNVCLDLYERTDLHDLFGGDAEEARRGRRVFGEENEDALTPSRHLGPRRGHRYRASHEIGNGIAIHFAADIDVPFESAPERARHVG